MLSVTLIITPNDSDSDSDLPSCWESAPLNQTTAAASTPPTLERRQRHSFSRSRHHGNLVCCTRCSPRVTQRPPTLSEHSLILRSGPDIGPVWSRTGTRRTVLDARVWCGGRSTVSQGGLSGMQRERGSLENSGTTAAPLASRPQPGDFIPVHSNAHIAHHIPLPAFILKAPATFTQC